MTLDNLLFLFVLGVLVITVHLMLTNKITSEERDAMLKDEDMWP